jgi:NTP pyrophosphatase (non-canonical NTP hydrolase)
MSEPLKEFAARLQCDLDLNRRDGLETQDLLDLQALCVAEEAGEMVGAYRRWAGKARRLGTFDELRDEVADVLIVTAVFAHLAGIDIDQAIADKAVKIYSRGWKEDAN